MATEAESTMTEQGYAPQYGIKVMPKGDERTPKGTPKLMLVLSIAETTSTHDFYLCDASDNYQDIAKTMHDMICKAGSEGRRAQSGLVVVEGGSDGFRSDGTKQGRQFGSPRPEGA
jgi:hypothetical protein